MTDHPLRDRFSEIYATDEWGNGSGEGSLPIHTQGYARFVERFICDHQIRTVLDIGCGDWQFSRLVDWGDCRYLGMDVVPSVIAANQAAYSRDRVAFELYDGSFSQLPEADLLIAKDVLQHLSHSRIADFMAILPRYRFALITNCINPAGKTENRDIADGGFRHLDLTLPPFALKAQEVYRFSNHRPLLQRLYQKPKWTKKVLLWQC